MPHSSERSNPAVPNIPSFLALPAELRNKIYHHICHRPSSIRLYFYQDPLSNTPKPVVPYPSNTTIPTAFFLTCRQINAEASSMFYSTNTLLLNRTSKFATFSRPCFVSAVVKFFDTVGSRAGLVRSIVLDTFTFPDSVFLHTYVDGATRVFDPKMDVVEVTVLLRVAWSRGLQFEIRLIDVDDTDMGEERMEYWMASFGRECAKKIISVTNALLGGQLGLREGSNAVRAVAVKNDGSGGLICWADFPNDGQKTTVPLCRCDKTTEFTAKKGGMELEFATFAPPKLRGSSNSDVSLYSRDRGYSIASKGVGTPSL